MNISRRKFITTTGLTTAGLTLGGLAFSAKSYGRIIGSNDRINVAMMGTNSRGFYLTEKFAQAENTLLTHVCDVDSRVVGKTIRLVEEKAGTKARGEKDFRKMLENKAIDVVVIAAPDHWHAPASIMALQAGKHVYVEKPCSHNPREGELFVEAQQKYNKVVQMGNQQRSSFESIEAMKLIKEGAIGKVYFAKAWYSNSRGSIGRGKVVPVPEWLDWNLWQGPAPREEFRDNIVHYNWHWFWNWGTGEILNNGTHEIDICRWALGVDYPTKVSSAGGRYHFDDDWEFFDTQVVNYEFENNKMISWEGRSCNSYNINGMGRGASIHGTEGSIIINRSGYKLYDNNNKLVKAASAISNNDTTNLVGGGDLDGLHINNFLNGIRKGEKLNSPIDEGHKSVLLCHLGNISQQLGRELTCDPETGRISGDEKAMKMWGREYEKGWEITV